MTFDDIDDGAPVYLDTNILMYYFNRVSPDCVRLVGRCKRGEVYGLVSTVSILELCHQAMCEEAGQTTRRPRVGPDYLKDRPEVVRRLTRYVTLVEDVILRYNLGVIEVSQNDILRSRQVRDRYGLLTNDSITAQILYDYGIPSIATHDDDFDSIAGIRVFKPSDI